MGKYSHITTVIFDMDGTLIEHTWQLNHVCEALFTRFAQELSPITQEEFFNCYWPKSVDMWYMMVDRAISGDTAAKYGYVNTLRTLEQNVDLAQPMLNYWSELVLAEAIPFDDTFTVLKRVRQNYVTGILTNGFTQLQRKKIKQYDFDAYVDFSLVSEEAGYHKPDKRAFEAALKLAGDVSPSETLYVGDNPQADIEGALKAGITPIFMNIKNKPALSSNVVTIKQLSELLSLLGL